MEYFEEIVNDYFVKRVTFSPFTTKCQMTCIKVKLVLIHKL